MMLLPRRLTFQLTPLLDLLLIVIFAQFMEMQHTTERHEQASEEQIQTLHDQVQSTETSLSSLQRDRQREIANLKKQLAKRNASEKHLAAQLAKQKIDSEDALKKALDQRNAAGDLVANLFQIPQEIVDQALKAPATAEHVRTPEEIDKLKIEFRDIASKRGSQVIKHLLTYEELRKRCDIWEVYVAENGMTTLSTGTRTHEFRAETAKQFENSLFERYKSLPQPKSLVVMMLSYGDVKASYYEAAVDGLPLATERMRSDSSGRTRFEYAILGYDARGPVPASVPPQ